jgi:transposase
MSTHTVERLQKATTNGHSNRIKEMTWHPLCEKLGLMEGEEWDRFEASIIETKGPEEKIVYRVLSDGSWQGVDGRNRYTVCVRNQIYPPMECKTFKTEADVQAFIIRRNVLRRQLKPEVRREIVGDLREQGMSTRQIAETVGVSQKTIMRDISTESKDSVDSQNTKKSAKSTPKTVVGKDGKRRAAKATPKPHREPGDDTEEIEADEKAEVAAAFPRDEQGFDIPARLRDIFADRIIPDGVAHLKLMLKQVRSQQVLYPYVPLAEFTSQTEALVEMLRNAQPYVVHQDCKGKGCTKCRTSGYLPKWRAEEV